MNKLIILGVLVFCALLGAIAQVFFKSGMDSANYTNLIMQVFYGLVLYGVAMGLYLLMLKFGDVGRIYSMISLSYIFVMLLSWRFLNESLTYNKLLGSVVIVAGVFIIWS